MGKRSWKWVQVTLFHILPFCLPSSAIYTHIYTYIPSVTTGLAYTSLNSFDRFASINHMNSLRVIGDQKSIESYRQESKDPSFLSRCFSLYVRRSFVPRIRSRSLFWAQHTQLSQSRGILSHTRLQGNLIHYWTRFNHHPWQRLRCKQEARLRKKSENERRERKKKAKAKRETNFTDQSWSDPHTSFDNQLWTSDHRVVNITKERHVAVVAVCTKWKKEGRKTRIKINSRQKENKKLASRFDSNHRFHSHGLYFSSKKDLGSRNNKRNLSRISKGISWFWPLIPSFSPSSSLASSLLPLRVEAGKEQQQQSYMACFSHGKHLFYPRTR